MRKVFFFILVGLIISSFSNQLTFCQEVKTDPGEDQAKIITALQVEGNKVISAATILAKVKTKVGQSFSQATISEDLKRLYSLGFFTDVNIDLRDYEKGLAVVFMVTERPVLREILFEGNSAIKTPQLREAIKSKAGEFLDRRQLKEDVDEIRKLYEEKGFPLVEINYDTEVDSETNRATVYILVHETKRARIKRIYVEGNFTFSNKKIFKLISTRPDTLFTSGVFKKAVLDEDVEKIKDFYQNEGFLDAVVTSDIAYDQTGKRINVTIHIEEGERYFVGKIEIEGNIVFPKSEVERRLTMPSNAIFNHNGLRNDVSQIQRFYFEKGYIFAEVKVDTTYNVTTGKIDIIYTIVENEIAYVDRVRIRGNTKTKDIVIRRELRIEPGEPFDGEKLQRSKERLYNLGFFEEVSYDIEPGTQPNKEDLVVTVKEAKTGEFSFGAGYSSVDELVGFVEVSQNNFDIANFPTFTGDGQQLRVKAEFGTVREDYEVSFTEPWIFDRPLLFGFDVYQKTRKRESGVGYGYDEQRRGGDIRLGKEFGEYIRGDLTYRGERVEISDVPAEASADLKNEEGENRISSVAVTLSRDTRDNLFNPTKGNVLSGTVECAGGPLGADKDFTKLILASSWYVTHWEKLLLELRVRGGIVDSFDNTDSVPIYERFYAGGANTIRGYKERRVGPRDLSDPTIPIGGESILVANIEYDFPVIEHIKLAVFYDIGNVWSKVGDFASGAFKSAIGTGVRIKTPLGPIKLDYGYPLESAYPGDEKKGRFHFSMGRRF